MSLAATWAVCADWLAACRAESCEDGPFSLGARQVGMYMAGGKVDDITVIVACVESAAKL